MTDDAKKLQRAQLQVELDDAESDFACLRESSFRLVQEVGDAQVRLKMNINLEPSAEDFILEAEIARRLSQKQQSALESSAKAIAAIEELKVARQKIFNLRLRKKNLAEPSGMKIPTFY